MVKPVKKPLRSGSTHLADDGTVQMVDVSGKEIMIRQATAVGRIKLNAKARNVCKVGGVKGSVFAVAIVAAVSAAKRTDELIPLCHSLPLDGVDVDFAIEGEQVVCRASVSTCARTGVEMEALTAVHVGLLTVVDMCKAVDRQMVVCEIKLVSKSKHSLSPS